jgi:hypothetical protein
MLLFRHLRLPVHILLLRLPLLLLPSIARLRLRSPLFSFPAWAWQDLEYGSGQA